ncbi:hypothetical protein PILCRDRAFT_816701 [Piloderma croceum F 1598]|uniref:Uncharacterized protein n=1 Tax=Piloderma croceum (strain F 1598) TaxID=765440 RepID=A0A0C3FPV6_PILCF|nr:hypothetical protein PILCRDRAFT_816701 [Piloderma croceum F 1598]
MEESVPFNGPRPDSGAKYDSIQLCKKILAKYVTLRLHDYTYMDWPSSPLSKK